MWCIVQYIVRYRHGPHPPLQLPPLALLARALAPASAGSLPAGEPSFHPASGWFPTSFHPTSTPAAPQALLHSPLLRNHFLLDAHPRAACTLAAGGGACVLCELVSSVCCFLLVAFCLLLAACCLLLFLLTAGTDAHKP